MCEIRGEFTFSSATLQCLAHDALSFRPLRREMTLVDAAPKSDQGPAAPMLAGAAGNRTYSVAKTGTQSALRRIVAVGLRRGLLLGGAAPLRHPGTAFIEASKTRSLPITHAPRVGRCLATIINSCGQAACGYQIRSSTGQYLNPQYPLRIPHHTLLLNEE